MGLIRRATSVDVEALVGLADQKRRQYARYEPVFWRPAEDAEVTHRPFLASQIESDDFITLVSEEESEVKGFVIARVVPAPPVYHPGGGTCLIDDFMVRRGEDWPTHGVALLRAAVAKTKDMGAVQVVVAAGHMDEAKRAALSAAGLHVGTEWWMSALPADSATVPVPISPS